MKKNTERKIVNVNKIIDVSSSVFSAINPAFSSLTIITYAINSAIGYVSEDNIINRIKKFEKKLSKKTC